MKKINNSRFIIIVIVCTGILVHFDALSQKLPNKQDISMRAPADIKIDGKSAEWKDNFQAYNSATQLFYTIANDDDNFYLTIKVVDLDVVRKIFFSGITLAMQKTGTKEKISVTYPLIEPNHPIGFVGIYNRKGEPIDTSSKTKDSIMKRNNATLDRNCKYLRVTGINGFDTISVYNELGIKAAGRFNQAKAYILELAFPLKYADFITNKDAVFRYNIVINGFPAGSPGPNHPMPNSSPEMLEMIDKMNASYIAKNAPTDFWGEYTLAKKP